jgi:hypothetical protein
MLYLVPPNAPVTLEWDFRFEPGFDYSMKGKTGPQINWGPSSGEDGGLAIAIWWSGGGDPERVFQYILQNQRRGSTMASEFLVSYGPKKGEPPVEIGQWYHQKLVAMGGPGGYSRYYLDGVLMAEVLDAEHPDHPWTALTHANDPVQIPVCGWFGGDASYAAKCDSRFTMANIRIALAPGRRAGT